MHSTVRYSLQPFQMPPALQRALCALRRGEVRIVLPTLGVLHAVRFQFVFSLPTRKFLSVFNFLLLIAALHRATGFLARNAARSFFLVAINVSSAPGLSFLEVLDTIGLSDSSLGPSVCGEQCPSKVFCQMCAEDAVLDQEVDFIVMSTYLETNLDEDPCIFPSCGHILTMSSMDGIMDMAKHYTMGESTSNLPYPVALAASSSPFDMKGVKVCPHCRGSLRNVARYGRIVRRAVLDESTKRFINWARQRHSELAFKLMEHKARL